MLSDTAYDLANCSAERNLPPTLALKFKIVRACPGEKPKRTNVTESASDGSNTKSVSPFVRPSRSAPAARLSNGITSTSTGTRSPPHPRKAARTHNTNKTTVNTAIPRCCRPVTVKKSFIRLDIVKN